MQIQVNKVVILGAGVMGSQIAAHLVNAGFQVKLLDVVPEGYTVPNRYHNNGLKANRRNRLAEKSLEMLVKSKPPSFYLNENATNIEVGNIEDDFKWLGEADWIIEAISENFEAKLGLLKKIAKIRKIGTIISSNTSGISLERLAQNMDKDFQEFWLGTHFFNPPRYLKLLEIIPTSKTLPYVVNTMTSLGEKRLGKRIVIAKDTPNFIANRVGAFALQQMVKILEIGQFQIDEIDQLTGLLIGRSKSATFRTLDLVGLDTFVQVNQNILDNAPFDEQRELFKSPVFIKKLLKLKWLGQKSGQGLYKKSTSGEILTLNLKELIYEPYKKINYKSTNFAKRIPSLKDRLAFLIDLKDPVGNLIWKALSETLIYAANRIPEISDNFFDIDNAIKWGFNWECGPFELWDTLGPEKIAKRIESEQKVLPNILQTILKTPSKSFYLKKLSELKYFDFASKGYQKFPISTRFLNLQSMKTSRNLVHSNESASLIDLGQGVIVLEFHSKMNTISRQTLKIINQSIKTLQSNFLGMVIANQGSHFSAGADLNYILRESELGNWENLNGMIQNFQETNLMIKYSPKPILVAPFGLTLGGGCEISLHANRIQASAECYMGLVELGVGLIPAAGGTKEMVLRYSEGESGFNYLAERIKTAFRIIAKAKVSQSALEARSLGFLRSTDQVSINGDSLISDSVRTILKLVDEGFISPTPPKSIPVPGNSVLSTLKVEMHQMLRGNYISEYDYFLGSKLGYVLCGGDCHSLQNVSEEYLLDLERECFLGLCGEIKSQERIKFMLKEGRPLRN